jgi:serine/tyrosine/threonine adenylyltransferase
MRMPQRMDRGKPEPESERARASNNEMRPMTETRNLGQATDQVAEFEMQFESVFVDSLPGDPLNNNVSRQVTGACYSLVDPTPVAAPVLLSYSESLARELGVPTDWLESQNAARVLGGNELLKGMKPYAMCYGGHQFGNWAGQLGDGRAINLGEWIAPNGSSWTWQLKGAGKTPYSRFGDGLAVLRSSLRLESRADG